jgi:ribonuclease HI
MPDERHGIEKISETPVMVTGKITIKDKESAAEDGGKASNSTGAIFTNGSRMDSGYVGCSVVWRQPNGEWRKEKYHLGKRKEIYDAELYAISEAVTLVIRRNIRTREDIKTIHIYTDSTAALNHLKNPNPAPGQWIVRKIVEVESMLKELGYQVEFHWVPGHIEIKGNEIADKTAKEVASYRVQPNIKRLSPDEHFMSLSQINRYTKEQRNQERRQ